MPAPRPLAILIAALGGEGGGVLSNWLVDAAAAEGLPVQSTSIPGVAQRTGATTYYVEIFPVRADRLEGRRPVMALTPSPGNIDLMVASELIEAGRAMQNGFVSPDRTTLVASTHRVFAIAEKSAMADGRFDGDRVRRAAEQLARRAILFDMAAMARQGGSVINAVLFGAICGSGVLPLSRAVCEAAIRASGKGVEASLRGFAAGFDSAAGTAPPAEPAAAGIAERPVARVRREFPVETHRILEEGVSRLEDYQDPAYAELYLDRLRDILRLDREGGGAAGGYRLTAEAGRHLALWMSYEDVIRVAALKTRPERLAEVREQSGAAAGEPVRVTEFLKPGLEEFCSLLPPGLAGRLRAAARRHGLEDRLNIGLHVRTSTISGYLLLRAMAALRPWRRRGSRFAEEQARMERWLRAVRRAAGRDLGLALEVAECARLVKGYGDTHRRGVGNFERIMTELIEDTPPGLAEPGRLAAALRQAREAALSDPEGEGLARVLADLTGTALKPTEPVAVA